MKKKKRERPDSPTTVKIPKPTTPLRKLPSDVKPPKALLTELKRKPSTDIVDTRDKEVKVDPADAARRPDIETKPNIHLNGSTKLGDSSQQPVKIKPPPPPGAAPSLPPPPPTRPAAPPRAPEDVLFRKKKKVRTESYSPRSFS
jgi:hypothetical protein